MSYTQLTLDDCLVKHEVKEEEVKEPPKKKRKMRGYKKRPAQSAAWVGTLYPDKAPGRFTPEFFQDLVERRVQNLRFIAFGTEHCPSNGREHLQLFLYFYGEKATSTTNAIRLCKNLFGAGVGWMEYMRGNFTNNEDYCSKESALQKFGDEPRQGLRGDLQETVDAIIAGDLTVAEIRDTHAPFYHQYGRTLRDVEDGARRNLWRTWMTEGIWYWGPAHTGKTEFAMEGYHPETHYVKCLDDEWWDGYKPSHETVILNEFRGNHMTLSQLLDIVDKWPHHVKTRGRTALPFLARKVIVTSPMHPKDVYPKALLEKDKYEQLERRFTIIQTKYDPAKDERLRK